VLGRFKEYATEQAAVGWSALGSVINSAKLTPGLRWANALEMKKAADQVFTDLFGPKDQAKAKAKARSATRLF
jgi:glutaminyl-tRNA synthetase